ncbi:MAG: hypothetical protein QGH33_05665 [Pirellulaceae bacterium]|jgi:hypothetical protein|nr:hypothetical protein [Pirellulaceae bacterium]HJN12832.1 hypothetical protein [Pirellulaceae bacterium]
MTRRGESIQFKLAEGVGLRATFIWQCDRYAHVVTLIEPKGEHTLLESAEGKPDDPWPPSPAFQQLSVQETCDQRVALLVGMSGNCHWSMGVEVSQPQGSIVFDVACRVNESVETLGSSYRADGYTLENPNTAVGRFGAMRHALVLDSTLGPVAQSLSMSADQLRVDCLMARSTMPHTARWKYAVALT